MQKMENYEREMLQKLTTTFQQMAKTEDEIKKLQKGSIKSNKNSQHTNLNRKLNALLSSSNSQSKPFLVILMSF